jgi:hypothetical protein
MQLYQTLKNTLIDEEEEEDEDIGIPTSLAPA